VKNDTHLPRTREREVVKGLLRLLNAPQLPVIPYGAGRLLSSLIYGMNLAPYPIAWSENTNGVLSHWSFFPKLVRDGNAMRVEWHVRPDQDERELTYQLAARDVLWLFERGRLDRFIECPGVCGVPHDRPNWIYRWRAGTLYCSKKCRDWSADQRMTTVQKIRQREKDARRMRKLRAKKKAKKLAKKKD
jgi:hypothetical protein